MSSSRIPSPSRSKGGITPRRYRTRASRSIGSPARSNASGRPSTLVQQFKDDNKDSFMLSPFNGRSVLSDNTDVEQTIRKSWWKNLDDSSKDMMNALSSNVINVGNNFIDELDVELLSQDKQNVTLDIPESSGSESIGSIVLPQRKLFNHKENVVPSTKKFSNVVTSRETLSKHHKSIADINKSTKKLFGKTQTQTEMPKQFFPASPNKTVISIPELTKPTLFSQKSSQGTKTFPKEVISFSPEKSVVDAKAKTLFTKKPTKTPFPSALLAFSPDKTTNKTKEAQEVKGKVRNLFGNRQNKRKQMFADFIVSESEDEIAELAPKRFSFSKRTNARSLSSSSYAITDAENDDWKALPSSTMMEMTSTPLKKPRYSKSLVKPPELTAIHASEEDELHASENEEGAVEITNHEELDNTLTNDNNRLTDDLQAEQPVTNEPTNEKSNNISKKNLSNSSKVMNESLNNVKNRKSKSVTNSSKNIMQENESLLQGSLQENITIVEQDESKREQSMDVDENEQESEHDQSIVEQRLANIHRTKEVLAPIKTKENEIFDVTLTSEPAEQPGQNEMQDQIEKEMTKIHEESTKNASKKNSINASKHLTEYFRGAEKLDKSSELSQNEVEDIVVEQERSVLGQYESEEEQSLEDQDSVQDIAENEPEKNNENELDKDITETEQSVLEPNESTRRGSKIEKSIETPNKSQQKSIQQLAEIKPIEVESEEVNKNKQSLEEQNISNKLSVDDKQEKEKIELEHTEFEAEIEQDNEEIEQEEPESEQENVESEQEEVENEQEQEESEQEEPESEQEESESEEEQVESEQEEPESEQEDVESEQEEPESEQEVVESRHEEPESEQEDSQQGEPEVTEPEEESEQEEPVSEQEQEDSQQDEPEVTEEESEPEQVESEQEQSYTEHVSQQERSLEEQAEQSVENEESNSSKNIVQPPSENNKSVNNKPRMTIINNTKSVIARESVGFSDGTRDSSAEGSGWDSHRVTKKTLRKTFGKEFTPRKSLRALVIEKSAKRQTFAPEITSVDNPQANSTELNLPESEPEFEDSNHEISRHTKQTTLENYLQKIKERNLQRRLKVVESMKNRLEAPKVDLLKKYNIPAKIVSANNTKPKTAKRVKRPAVPLGDLPQELIEDLKYKPPKKFAPRNASWITKRLYKHIETKLEPRYDYKTRVKAEKFMEMLFNFSKIVRKYDVAPKYAVDELKHEMARLDIVKTHIDFHHFIREFLPYEIKIKVVPDIVNKIPMPREGVYADILHEPLE